MYRKNKKQEFYTKKAREEGYPARSVYKLEEIDKKFRIFKKGDCVLDLGCSPGSWLLYISKRVGEGGRPSRITPEGGALPGRVVGIDAEDIKIPQRNNIIFMKRNVLYLTALDLVQLRYRCDAVVSDLAPSTTGVKSIDVGKSLELSEKAFELAKEVLTKGGSFICKVFEGEGSDDFFKKVAECFDFIKRFRPKAVLKGSKEFYIVAKKFGARQ